MTNIDLEQWSKIRDQGKSKYLLIHWVLLAAMPVAIIIPVIRGFFIAKGIAYFISPEFVKNFLLFFILCIVISLIIGNAKWKKNEKIFKDSYKD